MSIQSLPSRAQSGRTKARNDIWGFIQTGPKGRGGKSKGGPMVIVNGQTTAFNSEKALGIIKTGISSKAIEPLSAFFGVGKGELVDLLDLDRTTALRRANKGQPLPTHSAESVLRLLELEEMANDTFESEDAALAWLRRPHPLLGDESPLESAKTSFGARRVKDILVAIKYGGVV